MNTTTILALGALLTGATALAAAPLAPTYAVTPAQQSKTVTFDALPTTLETFKALAETHMETPEGTLALAIVAFNTYPKDKELALQMVELLRGPAGLSSNDRFFIADRFSDKDYVPRSYFEGATPGNDYTPTAPYRIRVSTFANSYAKQGVATLWLHSSGADSPRSAEARKAKDGKWYLWSYGGLLMSIRIPESQNPWE